MHHVIQSLLLRDALKLAVKLSADCVLLKEKIQTIETEKLLRAQRRGRMRGLWLLQAKKEKDCCPFMLRMHFPAQGK